MKVSKTDETSLWSVFTIFLRLGLTSFGGPVAHLAYFRDEFVVRRAWLSERNYADLVALCQFLPGPASSQVGLSIGLYRQGYRGALAAWLGFTLPSAIALICFANVIASDGALLSPLVLQGLKIVVLAVIAQAVWGMARSLCPDRARQSVMVVTACLMLWQPSAVMPLIVIALGAIVGLWLYPLKLSADNGCLFVHVGRRAGALWLLLFAVLLVLLPLLSAWLPGSTIMMLFDAFYRVGSLVFGGGHVVLPLLQAEVVPSGLVSNDVFLAGYGAAQAVPGPLFTFAAFLGASMNQGATGWVGGAICLVAIFLPSFFLVAGALPFWQQLRLNNKVQAALLGVNAAVVGLLLATLYQPAWTSAIKSPLDFGWALLAFMALVFWKLPPWLVVLGSGLLGGFVSLLA
ncbi:MAG: chromate efflux transporter [Hahellaceae bacterium]|nr:chromate efflux transporter [Hahellaceae bacterium]